MSSRIKNKVGSLPVLSLGLILVLLLLNFLIIEMGSTYENYDYCMDVLQRSCNSAVEANIDDAYRADNILLLDTAGAEQSFRAFVTKDLSDHYTVTFRSITCTETPPSMEVIGTVTFSTLFKQYGWDDLTFDYKIRATNYDLNG